MGPEAGRPSLVGDPRSGPTACREHLPVHSWLSRFRRPPERPPRRRPARGSRCRLPGSGWRSLEEPSLQPTTHVACENSAEVILYRRNAPTRVRGTALILTTAHADLGAAVVVASDPVVSIAMIVSFVPALAFDQRRLRRMGDLHGPAPETGGGLVFRGLVRHLGPHRGWPPREPPPGPHPRRQSGVEGVSARPGPATPPDGAAARRGEGV